MLATSIGNRLTLASGPNTIHDRIRLAGVCPGRSWHARAHFADLGYLVKLGSGVGAAMEVM